MRASLGPPPDSGALRRPAVLARRTAAPTFRASVDRVTLSATVRTTRGQAGDDAQGPGFPAARLRQPRADPRFPDRPDAGQPGAARGLQRQHGRGARRAGRARARASPARAGCSRAWIVPASTCSTRSCAKLQPLAPAPGDILAQLDSIQRPFGATSLFDAIAETGRLLAGRVGRAARGRRADRRRRQREPADAGGSVGHRQQHRRAGLHHRRRLAVRSRSARRRSTTSGYRQRCIDGPLGNLARWTGGDIFAGVGPAQPARPRSRSSTELRQQYLIAFEPDRRPGWHPIELRTREARISSCARAAGTSSRTSRQASSRVEFLGGVT